MRKTSVPKVVFDFDLIQRLEKGIVVISSL